MSLMIKVSDLTNGEVKEQYLVPAEAALRVAFPGKLMFRWHNYDQEFSVAFQNTKAGEDRMRNGAKLRLMKFVGTREPGTYDPKEVNADVFECWVITPEGVQALIAKIQEWADRHGGLGDISEES